MMGRLRSVLWRWVELTGEIYVYTETAARAPDDGPDPSDDQAPDPGHAYIAAGIAAIERFLADRGRQHS